MNSTFRQVGVATGVAAMGAIFDHALSMPPARGGGAAEASSVAYADGLHHVFLAGSAIATVGAVLAAVLVRGAPTPAPRRASAVTLAA
jgi:hypothetical protein